MSFVNLHCHSHYSLLDGFGSPESIVLRAKELGYPAAALTDHGVTYGLIEFYKACKKHDIKPILGTEAYVARRSRTDKEANIDNRPYHMTLFAKNMEGYKNILKLVTSAHLEGFYYKPRVDYGLLKAHSKGIIALSGCLQGHIPQLILDENDEELAKVIKKSIEIFGKDDFYLEMQDHPLIDDQAVVNERLKELSKEYGLQLVVTNDSHYSRPEDSEAHDILLCIQTGSTVDQENRMRYTGDFSIREVNDLKVAFKDTPEAIENTLKIAEKCDIEFEFGNNLIPSFDTPQNEDPHSYLRTLCEEGLKVRFDGKKMPKEYNERLDFELDLVHKMGFDTYFLIVWDFVKYAKDKGIVVGPGRGSAAGSIIAWSLQITDLDPIFYGLFFERFLNPERISMPDIDIDFADNRRDEVLDYVYKKYGRENVAQIITFGTMAPRAAVRDVGRALGYPYPEVDKLSKIIPPPVQGRHVPLKESIKDDPDLKHAYENDPRATRLLDYAIKLEGTVRHSGTHACAVVISEKPLVEYTALQYGAGGSTDIVTQYSMKPIEELGLLKMDFLGLKNLTVIEQTCKFVKQDKGVDIDMNNLDLEDKKTFELLRRADTTGVFQLESSGMRRYLKELKPNMFDDIVAMGALYRPGPMEWIPDYIAGKHDPDAVKYLDESFKPILENTYGVAVYQEQILQLARDFAGFSLGEADILRKAVGKKIPALLAEQKEKFIEGAVKDGHDKKFSEEVFTKVIEPFAGYGFNKAHAVCYGMIAFQTAYLKAHYPLEFMTALLCSDSGNTDRVVLEIKECNEMGIDVLPPSVNESFRDFSIIKSEKIRFGLLAIKGLGEGPINEMIAVRDKHGEFKSLEDFANRVPAKILNKKLIQALAYTGALDDFGDRNQIAENYEAISKYAKLTQKSATDDQTSIFGIMDTDEPDHGSLELAEVPPANEFQKLKWEKQLLGMYVTGHPLRGLGKYLKKKSNLVKTMSEKDLGRPVTVIGIISEVRRIMTKAGGYMVTFLIEDTSGKVNCIMFTKAYAHFGEVIVDDRIVSISGRLDNRRGGYQIMVDSAKVLSIETMVTNAKNANKFDPDEKLDLSVPLLDDLLRVDDSEVKVFNIEIPEVVGNDVLTRLNDLLGRNKGKTPVSIHIKSARKTLKLPFGVKFTSDLKDRVYSLLK